MWLVEKGSESFATARNNFQIIPTGLLLLDSRQD